MKLIREHNDFDWVNNDNNLNGVKIKTPVGKTVITIIDDGGRTVLLTWGEGGRYSTEYDRKTVESFIARGTWTLTESTDDFDWIRDHTVNPFMENDYVVVFIPKGTNLKYIEQLFDLVKSSGVETSNMSMTLQRVLHYAKTEEDTFIFTSRLTEHTQSRFDEKRMFYGHGRRLFEAYKWDNVSDEVVNKSKYDEYLISNIIKPNNLTESDDFDWIRDTVPAIDEYNPPKRGDVLICLPGYHADPDEQSELDDPEAAGFGYANGRIIVVGEVEPNLHYPEGKRIVVWPDEEKSKLYWHDDNVCEECGIYGLALTYYMGDKLNESDDFDWIRDIEPGIELKPRTMYYFEPKLTVDEVERFANVISNSDYIKNWMLTKVISRMSGDRQGDNMSYFVTSDSIDELVAGWCLTSNPHSMSRSTYRDYDFVDARNEFNF